MENIITQLQIEIPIRTDEMSRVFTPQATPFIGTPKGPQNILETYLIPALLAKLMWTCAMSVDTKVITSYYIPGFYNMNKWYGVVLISYTAFCILNRGVNFLMIWLWKHLFNREGELFFWLMNWANFWIAPLQQASAPIGLSSFVFLQLAKDDLTRDQLLFNGIASVAAIAFGGYEVFFALQQKHQQNNKTSEQIVNDEKCDPSVMVCTSLEAIL